MYSKTTLIGNLGADPDVRITNGGKQVVEIRLATSWGTGDNKKTEWHRVILFDKLGDVVAKYTRKGSLLFVEGRLQYRQYEDKDGNTRYMTEVIANEVKLLTPKGEAGQASGGDSGSDIPF